MFNPFISGLGMFGGYGGYRPPMPPMFNSIGRPPMMGGFGGFGSYGSPFGGLGMFGMSPYGGIPNYGMFGGMMNPFMNTQPTPNQLPADAVMTGATPRPQMPFQQSPAGTGETIMSQSNYVMPAPGAPVNSRLPPLPSVISPESKTILTDAPQLNKPYLR